MSDSLTCWLSARLNMRGQAKLHFRRVEAGSELSSEAGVWLQWLEDHPHMDMASEAGELNLPQYCHTLLPALAGNPCVNMLKAAK